jgi:molecular chaperone GrpE
LQTKFSDLAKGLEMTAHSMDTVLKRFQVVKVDPLGDKFDPNLHEAVFMMQDPE